MWQSIKRQYHEWFYLEDWADQIQLWASMLLQLAIVVIAVSSLIDGFWLVFFTAVVVFLLTFVPAMLERQLCIHVPVEFTLFNCMFLYAAFALGEVESYYERYWWWDIMLHSMSAMVMGIIGFLLVYVFLTTRKIALQPVYVAMFSFGFAVSIGTMWEIFEYLMDYFFFFTMQDDLHDTMSDLLVDSAGAMIAAYSGFRYVRNGDSLLVDKIVRRFVSKNSRLFKQRRPKRGC